MISIHDDTKAEFRYAGIQKYDINNGIDFGVTFFFQGCPHHCHGCHNPETWSFNGGRILDEATVYNMFSLLDSDNIARLTLSGGEPFAPENKELALRIARRFKTMHPDKSLWAYSGYTFENISAHGNHALLELCDVLVDGRFILEDRDITLPFRGSSNQRIIDVQKSLESSSIVLWEGLNI